MSDKPPQRYLGKKGKGKAQPVDRLAISFAKREDSSEYLGGTPPDIPSDFREKADRHRAENKAKYRVSQESSIVGTPTEFYTAERDAINMDKAPTFSGKPGQLQGLITYVKLTTTLDEKLENDPEKKAALFARQFRGRALEWLNKAIEANDEILTNYVQLEQLTKFQFEPSQEAKKQIAHKQLQSIRQKTSTRDFALDLENLAAEAGWTDDQKKAQFMQGLKPAVRQAIITLEHETMAYGTIVKRACAIDDETYYGRKSQQQGKSSGSQGCFNCGKFGHKAKNCRGSRKNTSTKYGQREF